MQEEAHQAKKVIHKHSRSSRRASMSSESARAKDNELAHDMEEIERINREVVEAQESIGAAAMATLSKHNLPHTGAGIDRVRNEMIA